MTRIVLGGDAFEFDQLILPQGDFDATARYMVDGVATPWPAGTTLALIFDRDGTSWAATISGADATWSVDKAITATRQHQESVRLQYTNGTTDRPLGLGRVVRRG